MGFGGRQYLAEILREPLCWMGATEIGYDTRNRPVEFQLTELGQAALLNQVSDREKQEAAQAQQYSAIAPELSKPILVQPNFELMVLAPLQNLALIRQI